MRAAVLTAAILLATAATAHAGGAILIPPLELDTGMGAPIGGGRAVSGPEIDMLAGIHWASLAWKPTHIEIGAGYVGSQRSVFAQSAQLRLDGCYLELGRTLAGSTKHWRTWITARGELLHGSLGDSGFSALGGALRIASEVYVSGAAGGNKAAIVGTLALGVYVEASHRELASELGPNSLSSGVSLRLPFIFAGS